ncbi:MAG TPA: MFS transporter [Candidatus Kapabacteria bacterium]|nr:MFS transporter [Candidatus Kapabacteria bacterium]
MGERGLAYKLGLLFCLYFSQGLPFGLFSHAVPTLLRSYGVDLEIIGLVSMLGLPWALKFLWAPWVDRYHFPRLGQRKSWILPLQVSAVLVLVGFTLLDPAQLKQGSWLYLFILLGLINLIAATQDIATDGLAVQALRPQERGLANGLQVGGYRVGMLFGGGLVLVILDYLGWQNCFYVLALVLLLVTIPVLFYREEASAGQMAPDHVKNHVQNHARPAWSAIVSFAMQPGMWAWLVLLMLYKVGDSFGSAMGKPLLVDLGLTLEQIGWIGGGVGMGAGILGAVAGGWWVQTLGRVRALVLFGVLQSVALLGYAWLAWAGPGLVGVVAVNALEHFAGGMATAALFTLMMDACRHEQAGSDYAVQASLQVSITGLAHALSGFSAKSLGYGWHFVAAMAISLLALLLVRPWLQRLPQPQRAAWHA